MTSVGFFAKEKRDKIFINGKPTKSLDYSASTFSIMYEVQHYGCINWDIPMLTVYDEFIFPEDKEDAVEELMFSVGLGDEYKHPYTEIIKEHAEFIRQKELDRFRD